MSTYVRILICRECKTLEVLPDFTGPAERDDTLIALHSRHTLDDGRPHVCDLGRVEESVWNDPSKRQAVEGKIREAAGGGDTGLGALYYQTRDTFREDAMTCWAQHNRVRLCGDYKSDRKLLVPDTKAERKEAGIGKYKSKTYLCDFCPVRSTVQEIAFRKQGIL
jgi:hypothetical protein